MFWICGQCRKVIKCSVAECKNCDLDCRYKFEKMSTGTPCGTCETCYEELIRDLD